MSIGLRNKLLLVLFLLFVLVSSFGITYSIVKIKLGPPVIVVKGAVVGSQQSVSDDGIVQVDANRNGNIIEVNYEVTLNGKTRKFSIEYSQERNCQYPLEECKIFVKGNGPQGIVLFDGIYRENEQPLDINYFRSAYDSKYMSIVKGTDGKSYLVVMNYLAQESRGTKIEYFIFDDELKYINQEDEIIVSVKNQELQVKDEVDVFYRNDLFDNEKKQIRAKLEDGQIYYLKHIHQGDCLGSLEDRIYHIDSGSIRYEAKRSFEIVNRTGACND